MLEDNKLKELKENAKIKYIKIRKRWKEMWQLD